MQEVLVRYIGFGPDEDEWVNVMKAVRERSITLERSECQKVKVGDTALCFQVLHLIPLCQCAGGGWELEPGKRVKMGIVIVICKKL